MLTFVQDFIRRIQIEFDTLMTDKQINSLFDFLEQITRCQRKQIILFGSLFLMIYLIYGWRNDLVCNVLGILLPAYASLQTIGVPKTNYHTKWLIYWIVYVLFTFFEYSRWISNRKIPFYWLGKWIFLMWLMMPGSLGGTHLIYHQFIRRFFLKSLSKKTNFYNPVAGQSHISEANAYDDHGNPADSEYDLGRDGAFHGYRILIGQFYTSGDMTAPIDALKRKGFHVDNVKNEPEFLQKLQSKYYQIAWVISASSIETSTFISSLLEFHSTGGAIFLFADNIPYIHHASEFLHKKFGIILTGNHPGNKTLRFKENGHTQIGHFGQHEIFTGIQNLFEGVTICHPVYLAPRGRSSMNTVATATDGNPCIVVFDPPMHSDEGRLCLDCGFTKLFINWNSAGTARFVVNVSCWLAKVKR